MQEIRFLGIHDKSGAEGGTRTRTACATAPSRRRVYQFHHIGTNFLNYKRNNLTLTWESLQHAMEQLVPPKEPPRGERRA